MDTLRHVICYLPSEGEQWRKQLLPMLGSASIRYSFYTENEKPRGIFANRRWVKVALMVDYLRFAWQLRSLNADYLITHNPRQAFWCSLFILLLGIQIQHIAYSFNYHDSPRRLKRHWQALMFRTVDRFVVHSTQEHQRYSDLFGIDPARIDLKLWSMDVPQVSPAQPLVAGDYICALGTNARDYPALLQAMQQLPDIPLVLVVRPDTLTGLEIPGNVTILSDIPEAEAMNILKYSRFMILPLRSAEECCGHITLVAAMHLGKALVITRSTGVADYIFHNQNAVTCEAHSPAALVTAISTLWNNPDRCQKLGEAGKTFAAKHCSGESGRQYLQSVLLPESLLQASSNTAIEPVSAL